MAADITIFLGTHLLTSSVILGITYVTTLLLRRRAASLRHLVWVVAFGLLLIVPLVALLLPQVEIGPAPSAWVPDSLSAAPDPSSALVSGESLVDSRSIPGTEGSGVGSAMSRALATGVPWSLVICAIYALLSSVLLARLTVCLATLRARLSRLPVISDNSIRSLVSELAEYVGVRRAVLLRRNDRRGTPWTWGGLRPVIVLPEDFETWPLAEQRNALMHEIAHVRRLDFLASLLGQLILVLYWFQPLAWSAERARRREAEYSSDDIVVSLGASPSDYANQLLGIARILHASASPGAFVATMAGRPGQLLPRVDRILDPAVRRTAMRSSTKWIMAAVGAMLAVPLAVLEPRTAVSQEDVTASDIQRVLVSGPSDEAELDATLEFLIEGRQNDRARALIRDWLSVPEDAFDGCDLCWRLIDWQEDSPIAAEKRSALMAAFGDVEADAQTRASPDLLMRLVAILSHAETGPARELEVYYLLQARQLGELSDAQKLMALNVLAKVGQYDAALSLAEALHKDEDSDYHQSDVTRGWISFIRTRQSLVSRMGDQLSPAQSDASASATYEYLPAYKQPPVYPPEASARKAEGDVVVRYTVTATGRTRNPVIVESTDSVFEQSALDSVAGYRYLPRVRDGVPVDVSGVQVRILYRLE